MAKYVFTPEMDKVILHTYSIGTDSKLLCNQSCEEIQYAEMGSKHY